MTGTGKLLRFADNVHTKIYKGRLFYTATGEEIFKLKVTTNHLKYLALTDPTKKVTYGNILDFDNGQLDEFMADLQIRPSPTTQANKKNKCDAIRLKLIESGDVDDRRMNIETSIA